MENKFYYIVAVLDTKGTEAITNLQKEVGIELDKLNDVPHITLSTYKKEVNISNLLEWIKGFAQRQKSIEVCLHTIAVFNNGRICAIPCFTKELYELHYNVNQKHDEYRTEYSKTYWLPHVTIAYDNGEKIINENFLMAVNSFEPMRTTFFTVNALWVSCLDHGNLTILGKFPLQD